MFVFSIFFLAKQRSGIARTGSVKIGAWTEQSKAGHALDKDHPDILLYIKHTEIWAACRRLDRILTPCDSHIFFVFFIPVLESKSS